MTDRITQQQLESYLWGAAVLLRGTIDAGDYKQFIFPLLFFKRLCDVYDEETQTALAESDGDGRFAQFPENHRFQIPPEAHWRQARQVATDLGRALQSAMRAIETANPDKLYGIFGDAQWTNKERLSDAMLRDLVEHFSSLDLSLANLPEDELGQGYEYLIKRFADDSGHTAAEFYTNRTVVHLMTELLQPQPGESIYDPTCGSGGMLLSCIAHLRRRGKEWRNVRLYGQERNLMTSSIARMNCFLHGIEGFRIERGDTLAQPKFVQGDRLMQFEVVLANPPYSIKQWDREAFASDPWGRNLYGTPPQGRADYAFWQHILCSLSPKAGRCAILFPHGVLFRQEEADMRRKLIDADVIECILGLGPNLFYNSPMEACVVICRAAKPAVRRGKMLFINAVGEVTRERAQSSLTDEHVQHIVQAYQRFRDQQGFARVASLDEIRARDGNLSIPLYVAPGPSAGLAMGEERAVYRTDGLPQALDAWLASRRTVVDSLHAILPDLNLPDLDETPNDVASGVLFDRAGWQQVRFGDVVENLNETEPNPAGAGTRRFIGLEHLEPGSLHVRQWGNVGDGTTFTRRCRPGQVLFGKRRAYQRKVAFAEFDAVVSGDIYVFAPKKGQLLSELLPFLCMSERFCQFAVETSAGSLSPRTNWSHLAQFEFALPPLDQQRRIAEVLWAVDEMLCCQEELASSMSCGIIAERDALFRTAGRLRTEPVGTLFEVQLGKMLSPKSKRGTSPFPYMANKNVQWGRFELSDIQEMDFSPEEFRKFRLQRGDLLVCEGGEVGRSAIWDQQIENCCFQKAIHRLRPLDRRMSTEYMLEFMIWASTQGLFTSLTGQSTIAHLTAVKLRGLPVPLVDGSAQQGFLERIHVLNDALTRIREGREETVRLRAALLKNLTGDGP